MKAETDQQITVRVSVTSIVGNILLTLLKLLAGIFAHSGAMVADAIHSFSDVATSVIVIIGANISAKEADTSHPYGHERLECIVCILLADILLLVGIGIGYGGVINILNASYRELPLPGLLALIAALLSIAVKEAMFWYTRKYAIEIDSVSLRADAWHHRSDALSSVGSFIGILGARLGLPILDPIAGVVISLLIIKVSFDIFRQTVNRLVDHACDSEMIENIRDTILGVDGVLRLDKLQTRQFGSKAYVDVELSAADDLNLLQAHAIAENVHDAIERQFPQVKHCTVHVNPIRSDFLES